MKLLYVITRAEAGGAQVHLLHLLRHVVTLADVVLVTGEEGYLTEQARALGACVHVLPTIVRPLDPVRDIRATAALVRLVQRERPDLVHLHSSKAGVVGRLAALFTGTPCVFTAHGWGFTENTPVRQRQLARFTERLLAPLARRIIAVSGYDHALAIREGVAATPRMVRIHNGIPDVTVRPQPRPDGRVRCAMTARFTSQKNQFELIRAAAQVDGVHLVLIGDGPNLSAARDHAAQLGVSHRVEFTGNRTDVAELLASCDLFALVTHYEGFPLSVLEAMRAALPVIATDVGGVREAVQDGITGHLVAHGDENQLVRALRELTRSPELRAAMGSAGRARYLEHFTTDRMIRQTLDVYRDATSAVVESAASGDVA